MFARRRRRLRTAAALVAGGLVASAAVVAPGARAGSRVHVSANPGLYPAFSESVSDYVLRCSQAPVTLAIDAAPGVDVTVTGHRPHTGHFQLNLPLSPGQAFSITVHDSTDTDHYFARCLPSDFPSFGSIKLAPSQAGMILAIPLTGGAGPRYATVFNSDGVPVWWAPAPGGWYATLLPGNRIGWTDGGGAVVENLDGSGATRVRMVGVSPDFHELQQLANGDYLMIGARPSSPVNLTAVGGPVKGVLLDNVIEEITPAGQVAWSWSAAAHIGVTELQPEWVAQAAPGGAPADVFHMNSVEPDGNGFVVSFRHLNAVYRIDKATGAITWKIGGTSIPQSLQVHNDPVFAVPGGTFVGQHDARILPDGTLTLHDNGTNHRAPRAVRYALDLHNRTATLLEWISDPQASASICCGSARRLPGGDWVVSWGLTPYVEELNARSYPVLRIQWASGWFAYRAYPVAPGTVSLDQLRAAMDTRSGH
ncbi:MAG TPA: arylsulfotransferase family protein [Acidimicrobiales bacterium]|nr:arylsulfotransferase family protein [Acidimicrobiales bacterium]